MHDSPWQACSCQLDERHNQMAQSSDDGQGCKLYALYAPGSAGKSSGVMRPPAAPPAAAQRPPDMTPPEPGPPDTDGKSSALNPCLSLAACRDAGRLDKIWAVHLPKLMSKQVHRHVDRQYTARACYL